MSIDSPSSSGNWNDSVEFSIDDMDIDALDALPYGAIKVDEEGKILFYNKTEGKLSGRTPEKVIGRRFFNEVAPCTNMPSFYGRFLEAVVLERAQISFTFVFDFHMRPVHVRIDMRPAREAGQYWIFVRPIEFLSKNIQDASNYFVEASEIKVVGEIIDTTLCDKEPIAAPDAIQPHGALLAIDRVSLRVLIASQNVSDYIDAPLQQLLGEPAHSVFENRFLQAAIDATRIEGARDKGSVRLSNGRWVVYLAHRSEDLLIIELQFEMAMPIRDGFLRDTAYGFPDAFFRAVISAPITDFTAQEAARMLRDYTSYDRVIIYQFDGSGNGSVIAEDKVMDWEQSLLGLHFPASDIPKQARELYLRNKIRFAPNNAYVPIPLAYAREEPRGVIDLSFSSLRSVAPVHRAYLDNMGVAASFSVSIVVDGRLWGMVIGHHRSPLYLSWERLTVVERATELLGQRLTQRESHDSVTMRREHESHHAAFLNELATTDDLLDGISRGNIDLVGQFAYCEGAAVKIGERLVLVGKTPSYENVKALVGWLQENVEENVWATDCLSGYFPAMLEEKATASGLLVSFLTPSRDNLVLWFRPEAPEVTVWAGNPDEKEVRDGSLLPRRRFEKWIERKSAHSRPWGAWKLELANRLSHAMTAVLSAQFVKLQVVNEKLAVANGVKDRFLAQMSHELRTPLNAILGFSELIASGFAGPTTQKQNEYLSDVMIAGNHLVSLISDILEFSKLDAGKYIVNPVLLDAAILTETVIGMLEAKSIKQRVILRCHCDDSAPVVSDERAVTQILINLISNALKYTPENGSVDVYVSVDAAGVIFRIVDTGIGMDATVLREIGTPFYQAQGIYLAPVGTGLGVSIVKLLVKACEGSLEFESEPGKGTTVTVHLPSMTSVA